ncbi:E3 ubiquitin-protein ligase [Salvia divinorum]|uniref:E3 ubiquitin-protein ligase n=1 Tax=Salvia divinorum TaxID=28513 RepID=A0ABD1FK26_SALDI
MGLQSQLSDVSSESTLILAVVLIGKSARYLRSLLSTILRATSVFSPRFDARSTGSPHDAAGSGLAGFILLCEQLNLNRANSYANRSSDRSDPDCVVCLNRLEEGEVVRKLACCHVFHRDCLDGWLEQMNFSCPLCRAPLVTEERVASTRRRVGGDFLPWFPLE